MLEFVHKKFTVPDTIKKFYGVRHRENVKSGNMLY